MNPATATLSIVPSHTAGQAVCQGICRAPAGEGSWCAPAGVPGERAVARALQDLRLDRMVALGLRVVRHEVGAQAVLAAEQQLLQRAQRCLQHIPPAARMLLVLLRANEVRSELVRSRVASPFPLTCAHSDAPSTFRQPLACAMSSCMQQKCVQLVVRQHKVRPGGRGRSMPGMAA